MIRLPIMTISKACVECGNVIEFDVRAEDYDLWKEGYVLVQDALWYITPDKREMLLSGICGDCWNEMFSEENEE
jgi:hypothetical protein